MQPMGRAKILLAVMKPGDKGRVAAYLHPEQSATRRLAALGFLPGEMFLLERRRPDFLIRFGYTRVAINRTLARQIMVYKMTVSCGNR
ncbi:MAG: FeoA family protein [Bacillota bacterium]